MRAFAALLGAAALALASLVVAPLAAPAYAADSCSGGVLVVVDFSHFGGQAPAQCVNSPSNGFAALHSAGFDTEGTKHDGPGFICRIDGKPTPKQEACVRTPPASAYWSYWRAAKGSNSWVYSSEGAQSSHPASGAIDAWTFGGTDVGGTRGQPSFCPDYVRTGKASSCPSSSSGGGGGSHNKPKPGRTTAKSDRRGGSSDGGGAGGGADGSPTRHSASASGSASKSSSASPSGRKSSGASSSRPSSGTGSTAPAATGSSGSLPAIVDASEVAGKDTSAGSGSATPVILGAVLVVLLGGGAGWTVLRRRRADAADL